MGRHADPTSQRRPSPFVLVAAGLAVLLVAGGLAWWLSSGCDQRRTVDVTVAPELGDLTEELLSGVGQDDDACVTAVVTAQEPLQTAGSLAAALEADALPDVWVPDSSLWTARAGSAQLERDGSMALSPVVLATSSAVADRLGWSAEAPTWGEALTTARPLAVPDVATSAEGLSALAAVRDSLGGDEDADTAIVEAVLAAARAGTPSSADALAAATEGSADAPLVPVREQEVVALNQDATGPGAVAVYPAEGSPVLDYPVLRVGSPDDAQQHAVDVVVAALRSPEGQAAVREAGFRGPRGEGPDGAADRSGIAETMPETLALDGEQVQALLARLSSLTAPARLLTVFDVSTSMEAPVGEGTRATLARDAAKSTLSLVPDAFALGMWVFAHELDGGRDWRELLPTRELDTVVDGATQRELLDDQLDTIPERLAPGGTGLYDTTLAAVRAARSDYDPTAVNSVLLLTDGTDEDDATVGLDGLLTTLAAEADPNRPITVIGVALGPDADLTVLERIAEGTGGAAYSAVDERDLLTVLVDALHQRR